MMMRATVDLSERELRALEASRQKAALVAWLRAEAAARNGEMAWYVARTRWQADSVAADLRDAGIEAVCPVWRRWKRYPRSPRRYSVEMPLFGNHVFVRLLKAESAWVGVMTFEGVECLLGTGEVPVPVLDKEMGKVLEMLDLSCVDTVERDTGLMVGDRVVHPIGLMADLRGTVVEIDAEKREALITTMMFGREMETRCGIDDLEKLA